MTVASRVGESDLDKTPEMRLQAKLAQVVRDVEGVSAVAVGDAHGLPIASTIRRGKTMAATAMATLLLRAGGQVMESLDLPTVQDILIEGGTWNVVVMALGEGFTLLVVFPGSANLGLLNIELKRIRPEIHAIIEELR